MRLVCGHTKYEGCPPCPCERAVLDAWHEGRLVEVPVEPDYEAIAHRLYDKFAGNGAKPWVEVPENDKVWLRGVVKDGIGGSE